MPPPPRFAAAVAVLLLIASVSSAQVPWRTEYNAARREAVEKDRPLFIDFQTDNCFYCRKLEGGPFRDPAIAALLADKFVPVKLDGNREMALVQALRIQAYPTLVIAAPDGKILGTIEGYLETPRLAEQLQAALRSADWMNRDLAEASKAIEAGDRARAITLLKGIGTDGKDRPAQVKAKTMLRELEQPTTAADVVPADPQALARECEHLSERLAGLYIAQAEAWKRQGEETKAAECLELAVRVKPGSATAQVAQGKLASLRKPPTSPIVFPER